MLELMPCLSSLPDPAPLSSYRWRMPARVLRYGRPLRPIDDLMAKSGRNPDEFACVTVVAHRRSDHARGRSRHTGTSDTQKREVEIRHVKGVVFTRRNRGLKKGGEVSQPADVDFVI